MEGNVIQLKGVTTLYGPDPEGVLDSLGSVDTSSEASIEEAIGGQPVEAEKRLNRQTILDERGHTLALENISFSVKSGETLVITGLPGCGRSTLLRHISGMLPPSQGEVQVGDHDIYTLAPKVLRVFRKNSLATIFPDFGLLPHRSIRDNIAFVLEIKGVGMRKRNESAKYWLKRLGLERYAKCYPAELPPDQYPLVAMARAFAVESQIVLLDDAFSKLDPMQRQLMQDQLIALKKEHGKTVVMASNCIDEALRLCDRVSVLQEGSLIQIASPRRILLRPANKYVQRLTQNVNRLRALTVAMLMKPINASNQELVDQFSGEQLIPESEPIEAAVSKWLHTNRSLVVVDDLVQPIGVLDKISTLKMLKLG